MNHEEERVLSIWIDGALAPAESARVEAHVRFCGDCNAAAEGLLRAKLLLAKAARRPMPAAALARNEAWLSSLAASIAERRARHREAPRGLLASAGLVLCAVALAACLFHALAGAAPPEMIPIEPLLAAHFRYAHDATATQGNLMAANYSDGWAYDEIQNVH